MSGVHIALRTLWMRIDFPLKRSSAAALSDRIATRSSTAFRAIDCGTCFAALASPLRLLEMRGISSSDFPSSNRIDTRSTFMIWNVKSTTLSSRRSSSCCFDSSFEISRDRKSTRLNSSHGYISYAVFCLKKKKKKYDNHKSINTCMYQNQQHRQLRVNYYN